MREMTASFVKKGAGGVYGETTSGCLSALSKSGDGSGAEAPRREGHVQF